MKKRKVLINATMSVIQIVFISCVLFILYKFLLKTIGVEQLGIWSLVLATTSVSQIANFGFSGSVVKFVAKYIALEDDENVSKVIQTAALSISVFVGFVLFIGYPIAKWILGLVVSIESLSLAISILPYAFLSIWIMVTTSVFSGSLYGYQRIDIRSILLMGSAVFHLVLCFLFVPKYGLMGLAYAKLIQSISMLIISWLLLKKYFPLLPLLPYIWSKPVFKEMIGYGIKFQIISLTTMCYDPITKALLSKFGGLSMVGYYEMANRLVFELRTIVVSANQVLVPVFADLIEKSPYKIKSVYTISYQLMFYISLPLFSLTIILIPLISEVWIGQYEKYFVIFAILLLIGRFFNTIESPAYFANLGTGDLRWNVISHVCKAFLNGCLGIFLGTYFGGAGVVIAWISSLIFGSTIIIISYQILNKVPLIELFPKTSVKISLTCVMGILFSFCIHHYFYHRLDNIALNSLVILFFILSVIYPLWSHPLRSRMLKWITIEMLLNKGESEYIAE